MAAMTQYRVTLNSISPLIMHQDNLPFAEAVGEWLTDPANKMQKGKGGDDRRPAWTWLGYVYHDEQRLTIPADNLMTCIREGATKVLTGKGKETFKRASQSGLMLDDFHWPLTIYDREIPWAPLKALLGNLDFSAHMAAAEALGFELLVKRAKIQNSKHVRVRPLFRSWSAGGTFTVMDEEISGLTAETLFRIWCQAGALCGLGDWRPSSPQSSGKFGKFTTVLEQVN